jgi:hypothetical protein
MNSHVSIDDVISKRTVRSVRLQYEVTGEILYSNRYSVGSLRLQGLNITTTGVDNIGVLHDDISNCKKHSLPTPISQHSKSMPKSHDK